MTSNDTHKPPDDLLTKLLHILEELCDKEGKLSISTVRQNTKTLFGDKRKELVKHIFFEKEEKFYTLAEMKILLHKILSEGNIDIVLHKLQAMLSKPLDCTETTAKISSINHENLDSELIIDKARLNKMLNKMTAKNNLNKVSDQQLNQRVFDHIYQILSVSSNESPIEKLKSVLEIS